MTDSLTSEAIGSELNIAGSTVIIILPTTNSTLVFTWDATEDPSSAGSTHTAVGCIETPAGELEWSPMRPEKIWLMVDSIEDALEYKTRADCDRTDPCTCFSFQVFFINPEGHLVEVAKCVYPQFCSFPMLRLLKWQNSTEFTDVGQGLRDAI